MALRGVVLDNPFADLLPDLWLGHLPPQRQSKLRSLFRCPRGRDSGSSLLSIELSPVRQFLSECLCVSWLTLGGRDDDGRIILGCGNHLNDVTDIRRGRGHHRGIVVDFDSDCDGYLLFARCSLPCTCPALGAPGPKCG